MALLHDKERISIEALKAAASEREAGLFILVVGEVTHWQDTGRTLPADSHIAFADFHEVSPELLSVLAPDVILSPLLCGSFDCLDLAQILGRAGFRGRYRVMAPALPEPWVIREEVRALSPEVDFDVIVTHPARSRPAH